LAHSCFAIHSTFGDSTFVIVTVDLHHTTAAAAEPTLRRVAASLVIPAYNEAERLPAYLTAIREHYAEQFGDDYEILVVDDGSSDGLDCAVTAAAADWPQLTLLRHERNRGKGAAVRTGMLAAGGETLLFADADGATPIAEERRLRAALAAGADVAVGSRLLRAEGVVCRRSWRRALVGRAFAAMARTTLGLPIRDTQCGFKMFRREAAKKLFALAEEDGYLFDLEILMLARLQGYRVAEVPIHWADRPGSRLSIGREFAKIVAGLRRLRRRLT
jgi:dolichyl-phosphate beta-glucosyltransferase